MLSARFNEANKDNEAKEGEVVDTEATKYRCQCPHGTPVVGVGETFGDKTNFILTYGCHDFFLKKE